uniref:TETY2 transcript 1 n=1 Tax=Canis lupus familiaris TaxID=9615 RepID=S5TIZ0_CANLF|nr:TETY2 transcript 1 [Canis lupus familiaris]
MAYGCSCTAVTVSWNFAVDFYGQTTLDFPLSFPIGKEMLIRKHLSYVFPLGLTTATLSLISATMFFCETSFTKQWNQVKPMAVGNHQK